MGLVFDYAFNELHFTLPEFDCSMWILDATIPLKPQHKLMEAYYYQIRTGLGGNLSCMFVAKLFLVVTSTTCQRLFASHPNGGS